MRTSPSLWISSNLKNHNGCNKVNYKSDRSTKASLGVRDPVKNLGNIKLDVAAIRSISLQAITPLNVSSQTSLPTKDP